MSDSAMLLKSSFLITKSHQSGRRHRPLIPLIAVVAPLALVARHAGMDMLGVVVCRSRAGRMWVCANRAVRPCQSAILCVSLLLWSARLNIIPCL